LSSICPVFSSKKFRQRSPSRLSEFCDPHRTVPRSYTDSRYEFFPAAFKIRRAGKNIIVNAKQGRDNLMTVRRGDIYYADLSPVVGSEQGGLRPVLIVQNDVGNKYSPTVIAAAITSQVGKNRLPTHIDVTADHHEGKPEGSGLAKDSVILLEQIRTIDKKRLREKMGHLDDDMMKKVNDAIGVSFGLGSPMA
jgi:mRNA interferase MazF